MMEYDKLLDRVVQSVDGVIHEIDTEVRSEFSEFSDYIDIILEAFKCLDRNDVLHLQHQMNEIEYFMRLGATCPCSGMGRWHACLGRMQTAVERGAIRCKLDVTKLFVEEGILTEDAMKRIEEAVERMSSGELPDLPDDITIPDDASELNKDA